MKSFLPLLLLVSSCLLSTLSFADVWAEREALAKIKIELAALEALVINARSLSNPADRTTFNYEFLIDDLRKIQAGIAHHLTVPMEPVVPSTIDALKNDYTRHQ